MRVEMALPIVNSVAEIGWSEDSFAFFPDRESSDRFLGYEDSRLRRPHRTPATC